MKEQRKCSLCDEEMELSYVPMEEWKMDGFLSGRCYSQKLAEFYPGEHVRIELSEK